MFEDNPDEGFCFVLDLSERKKLEQQFLRAQRMESIGTLAGGVAHDLNNILLPIMLSIGILKREPSTPQTTVILETIADSAKRGADIVRQVLWYARGHGRATNRTPAARPRQGPGKHHPGDLPEEHPAARFRFPTISGRFWAIPPKCTRFC